MHHGSPLIGNHNRRIFPIVTRPQRLTGIRPQNINNGQVLGISLAEAGMPNILCDHYRGNMPNGEEIGHEAPTDWFHRVRRRQRAMITRYSVEVCKQSAGLFVVNAGLDGAICHGRSIDIGVIR